MRKLLIFLPFFGILSGCANPPKGPEANQFSLQSIQKIEADDYTALGSFTERTLLFVLRITNV